MDAFELYLPPVKPERNRKTGRWLPGHEPHNKGVEGWQKTLPKRTQRRIAKGWVNVEKYRCTTRPDTAGRCRKKVVVVTDEGKFRIFDYIGAAAEWVGGSRENVGRCCRQNMSKKVCKHDWRVGQPKGADRVNTDHKYKGHRFYFFDDPSWWDKVQDNV